MPSLSVGIVGLPNAGKSTLFNALASRRLAETAPRPFTTIEPHEAVVPVPDRDLERLYNLVKNEIATSSFGTLRTSRNDRATIVPALVTFIDIAGLVKGAHKGEGLGNQFLGKIREVDAIVHVVRAFSDPTVTHEHPLHEPGSMEQVLEDIGIVNIELQLGGIKSPVIYVLNVEEGDVDNIDLIGVVEKKFREKAITIAVKLEEDLIDLDKKDRKEYLKQAGINKSGLEKLTLHAYELLDLITFYTIKGGKEIHAWSLKRGSSALEAAEIVHTDFAKKFIKAEVILVDDLLSQKSWKGAKDNGKIRLEGKDYIVQDGDVVEFKIGS